MKAFRSNLGLISLLAVLALCVCGPVRGVEAWLHLGEHRAAAADGHGDAGGSELAAHHESDGTDDGQPDHPLDCSKCRELLMVTPVASWHGGSAGCVAMSSWCVDSAKPGEVMVERGFLPAAPPTGPPRG